MHIMNSTPAFSLSLSAAGAPSGELLPFAEAEQTVFSAASIVDLIVMLERTTATPEEVILSAPRLEQSNMAELYYVQRALARLAPRVVLQGVKPGRMGAWLAEMMAAVEMIPLEDADALPEHVATYARSSLAALSKRLVEQESASGSYI